MNDTTIGNGIATAEALKAASTVHRNDATASQVGPTANDFDRMFVHVNDLVDEVVALRSIVGRYHAALVEVVTAARRQLEGTGRGIEPSERLQEAFDAADALVNRK
jgi:hypothetical protein